jgi:hypothetical protein
VHVPNRVSRHAQKILDALLLQLQQSGNHGSEPFRSRSETQVPQTRKGRSFAARLTENEDKHRGEVHIIAKPLRRLIDPCGLLHVGIVWVPVCNLAHGAGVHRGVQFIETFAIDGLYGSLHVGVSYANETKQLRVPGIRSTYCRVEELRKNFVRDWLGRHSPHRPRGVYRFVNVHSNTLTGFSEFTALREVPGSRIARHRVGLHRVGLHWVGLHWVGLHWVSRRNVC